MNVRVGNDVVDLEEPAIAKTHLRPQFVARVCCESERVLLASSASPKALLWTLFAAKEAAFKVVSKLGPRPVFAHRLFVVADDLSSVQFAGRSLRLWIEARGSWVHALASSGEEKPLGAVEEIPPGAEPGASARAFLLRSLGLTGAQVLRDPIPNSWDGFGPPRLSPDLGTDISLSHDGRYIAYAASYSP